jgi:hypothetical protein
MEEWEEQDCRGRVFWRFKLKLRPNRDWAFGPGVQLDSLRVRREKSFGS